MLATARWYFQSIWLRHTPWGLRRMINWVNERYPTEIARGGIWITENGISLEEKFADVDRYQNIYLHFNEVRFSNFYS